MSPKSGQCMTFMLGQPGIACEISILLKLWKNFQIERRNFRPVLEIVCLSNKIFLGFCDFSARFWLWRTFSAISLIPQSFLFYWTVLGDVFLYTKNPVFNSDFRNSPMSSTYKWKVVALFEIWKFRVIVPFSQNSCFSPVIRLYVGPSKATDVSSDSNGNLLVAPSTKFWTTIDPVLDNRQYHSPQSPAILISHVPWSVPERSGETFVDCDIVHHLGTVTGDKDCLEVIQ